MNRHFKKLTIYEVALAGNPINKENFIIIKDGGKAMSDKVKFASLILSSADVQEVVKEELKGFLPKEGESLKVDNFEVKVTKDGYEIKNPEVESLKKDLEKSKKELEELKKDEPKDIFKDVPKEVKERLEKLEKEAKEATEKAETLRLENLKKDFASKIGTEMAETLMKAYDVKKEDAIKEVVEKIEGLKKMVKDLSEAQGKSGTNEKETLIKEGIEKIMKEEKLSLADATVKFYKENPELV